MFGIQIDGCRLDSSQHGKVLHLDIKPENVLLAPTTQFPAGNVQSVLLTDFGIAQRLCSRVTKALDTQAKTAHAQNVGRGTPGYASPEQSDPDERTAFRASDIYSVGATFLYAATDELPYGSNLQKYGDCQKLR